MWFRKRRTDEEWFQLGLKRINQSDLDGAVKCLNETIQLNPRHANALIQRSDVKRRQADYCGALSDINRALAYEPKLSNAYFIRAQVHLDLNADTAAIADLFAYIFEHYPTDSIAINKTSQNIIENLEYARARLTKQLQAAPNDAIVLLTRSLISIQLENFDAALNDLNRALLIDPMLDIALLVRGKILLTCGESHSAVEDLTAVIHSGRHNIQAHHLRGQARADLGDLTGARLDFGRSIQLAPNLASNYTKLAAIHSLLGNYEDVMTFSDAAIYLNTSEGEAYCYRAVARRVFGDLAGSIADCIHAMQASPNDHLPYMVRAMTFIEAGKMEYALRDANLAIERAPERARPYLTRGLAWQHYGNFEKAYEDMSMAIQIQPEFLDAYRTRAEMREQFGDLIGAMHDYQHLLNHAHAKKDGTNIGKKIAELRSEIARSLIESLELEPTESQNGSIRAGFRNREIVRSWR